MTNVDTLLVGFAANQKGDGILIVARKQPNKEPDIINAFEGSDARDIYEKLIGNEGK